VQNLRELSAVSQDRLRIAVAALKDRLDNELCISYAGGKALAGNWQPQAVVHARKAEHWNIRPLKSIWILRDITASKQAEQEREAARSAMALAEVSSILAHEIRNPLASMELFAGLIAEDPRKRCAVGFSSSRAGIRQLSGTVNNVLSIHCGGNLHLGLQSI
jgi:signal transduction histidine kinase